jgi:hypothetical protein
MDSKRNGSDDSESRRARKLQKHERRLAEQAEPAEESLYAVAARVDDIASAIAERRARLDRCMTELSLLESEIMALEMRERLEKADFKAWVIRCDKAPTIVAPSEQAAKQAWDEMATAAMSERSVIEDGYRPPALEKIAVGVAVPVSEVAFRAQVAAAVEYVRRIHHLTIEAKITTRVGLPTLGDDRRAAAFRSEDVARQAAADAEEELGKNRLAKFVGAIFSVRRLASCTGNVRQWYDDGDDRSHRQIVWMAGRIGHPFKSSQNVE